MNRVPYGNLAYGARNEPEKLPAVAGGPDVLVGADQHNWNFDSIQELPQLPADPGGIEKDASPSRGAFSQRSGNSGRAE